MRAAQKRNGRAKQDILKWGKLTDQVKAKLVGYVKEGLARQTCADLCGLARCTLYDWIAKGEKEPESRYGEFARAIARAEAEAVRRLHVRVEAADPAWLLSRRHPDLYGLPKVRVEASGPNDGPIEFKGELTHKIDFLCDDEDGFRGLFPVIKAATGMRIDPHRNESNGA
jgi:hypothetical protein